MIKYKDLTKIKIERRIACSCEKKINMPNEDRRLYLFLENNLSGAIFQSHRVSMRELILSVWLFSDSNILDVITLKSIKKGEMQDLKHYCVI